MNWRIRLTRLVDFLRECRRSRIAWLLATLHAAWFILAIANMSPPSPGLGEFLDSGGWSSATLLAGRPFHYEYEALALKLLILADLPSMLAILPVSLLLAPVSKVVGSGFYSNSYLSAGLMLMGATCQWLLAGHRCERWVVRRPSVLHAQLHRWWGAAIVIIVVATFVLAPTINQRSRALGFRHAAISFR